MLGSEAIYKGATRPAMLFGVPLVPLVVVVGFSALVALWGGILVSGWLALVVALACACAVGSMRLVTRRDDQRFRQLFIASRLRSHDRNRRLWRARSYAPNLYRGTSDARVV